jgi:hypothetical protein
MLVSSEETCPLPEDPVLAELARQSGDEVRWREEMSEAHRLFTAIGASGYAERVAEAIAPGERLRHPLSVRALKLQIEALRHLDLEWPGSWR